MGGPGGKTGRACDEFEDNEGGILGSVFLRVLVPAHLGGPG